MKRRPISMASPGQICGNGGGGAPCGGWASTGGDSFVALTGASVSNCISVPSGIVGVYFSATASAMKRSLNTSA